MVGVLRAWLASWALIFRRRLFHWIILSAAIAVLLQMGILGFSFYLATKVWSSFSPNSGAENLSLSSLGHFILQSATSLAVACIVLWLALRMYKVLYLTALSPLLSWMMGTITTQVPGTSVKSLSWWSSVIRSVLLAWRNFFIELALGLALWAFTWGIGLLAPWLLWLAAPLAALISLILSSYFYGVSLIDYTLEARGFNYSDSIRLYRKMRRPATYLGLLFTAITWIPWIGLTIAPVSCAIAAQSIAEKAQSENL